MAMKPLLVLNWIMWTLFKPLDLILEFVMAVTGLVKKLVNILRNMLRKPKREEVSLLFSHPAWLPLTKTGPLGQYVCEKGKLDGAQEGD